MRLSEAIRLGSMLGPQAFGRLSVTRRRYLFGLVGPKVTATCALGAASAAIGGGEWFHRDWLAVALQWSACPACEQQHELDHVITHLNDKHRWTRERIAGFVESREDALATGQTQAMAVVTVHV